MHYSSMVVRNSNVLVFIFLLGHEYMIAQSEVALFLWSLVPAGTKMEDVTWCQLFFPLSSFAHTNQQQIKCQYIWRQWEGSAHQCTVLLLFFPFLWERVQLNKGWHLSFHRKHCISLIFLLFWVLRCLLFFFSPSVFHLDTSGLCSEMFPAQMQAEIMWRSSFIHRLTKARHASEFRT